MVDQIIADVTDEETGSARIDVVVGTPRHQDHVSGLTHSGWAHVEVGEVWLPWTEDPEDSEATRIREAQSSAARHLYLGLERLLLGADDRALGLALNSLTNEKAMRTLPAGFAVECPRFRGHVAANGSKLFLADLVLLCLAPFPRTGRASGLHP